MTPERSIKLLTLKPCVYRSPPCSSPSFHSRINRITGNFQVHRGPLRQSGWKRRASRKLQANQTFAAAPGNLPGAAFVSGLRTSRLSQLYTCRSTFPRLAQWQSVRLICGRSVVRFHGRGPFVEAGHRWAHDAVDVALQRQCRFNSCPPHCFLPRGLRPMA